MAEHRLILQSGRRPSRAALEYARAHQLPHGEVIRVADADQVTRWVVAGDTTGDEGAVRAASLIYRAEHTAT